MKDSNPLRILHVNDVANVGSTMVSALRKLGHQADLRLLRLAARQRSTTWKLLALPLRLHEMASVNRQVKEQAYDIVHIHFAYLGWMGIAGRYPYYLHCHGTDIRSGLSDILRRWPVIQSLKQAKTVFFATPDLAPRVRAFRPEAGFLPDPVDTDRFRPVERPTGRLPKILIISWLSPIKNVSVAFEAIRGLLEIHPGIQVTAIDHGPLRNQYLHTAGVTFIPPVPYARMPELINDHDIVVGQFGIGCLSMAELESMACGKPVVCYFNFRDWYPEPPPVFSTNQPKQATEFLAALLTDPSLLRTCSRNSREWVLKHHDFMKIAHQLDEAYRCN